MRIGIIAYFDAMTSSKRRYLLREYKACVLHCEETSRVEAVRLFAVANAFVSAAVMTERSA